MVTTSTPIGDHPVTYVSARLRSGDDHAVVRSLLAVAAGERVPERALSREQFVVLTQHRVTSLIPTDWTIDAAVDPDRFRRRVAATQLRLYHGLEEIVALLSEHAIESRALKGLATSRLDYARPAMRQTADIDLLIPPATLERAMTVLLDRGGSIYGVDAKGSMIDMPSGVQVDLHTRLTKFSDQSAARLFADPVPIPGSIALALPPELRLVHAAAHLLYSPPGLRRLSGLADISAIRARHDIDVARAQAVAAELGIERIAGAALRLERRIRDLDDTEFASWDRPNRLERWSFVRADRRLLAEQLLAVASIDGLGARARYLRDWSLPAADKRDMRGGWTGYFGRLLPSRFGGQNIGRQR